MCISLPLVCGCVYTCTGTYIVNDHKTMRLLPLITWNFIREGVESRFLPSPWPGAATFSCKGQRVNIISFSDYKIAVQLLTSATLVWKQPRTIPKWRGVFMLHKQVADQIGTAIYSFPTVEIEFDTYTHVGYDSPNICIYVDWYLEYQSGVLNWSFMKLQK